MKMSNDDFLRLLGLNIVRYRNLRGYTQKQLAEMAGIPANHLSNIERGKINFSLDTLFAISDALAVKTKDLFSQNSEVQEWCRCAKSDDESPEAY